VHWKHSSKVDITILLAIISQMTNF